MKIKKENLDKILKLIDKINKKSNLNIAKGSDVILTLFLNDYYKDNPINFSDETLFNNRLTACQFVYGKYKKKIENEFSSDKNDGREMSN